MRIKGLVFIVKMYLKRLIRAIFKAIWNFLKKQRNMHKSVLVMFLIINAIYCISMPLYLEREMIASKLNRFLKNDKITIEAKASVGDAVDTLNEATTQDTLNGMVEQQASIEVAPPTIEDKICAVFGDDCELMIAIAKAESGLNPNAYHKNKNGSEDFGLFQINSIHGEDNLFDVDKNIQVAKKIYDTQGLEAWVVWKTGAYNKFLNS